MKALTLITLLLTPLAHAGICEIKAGTAYDPSYNKLVGMLNRDTITVGTSLDPNYNKMAGTIEGDCNDEDKAAAALLLVILKATPESIR